MNRLCTLSDLREASSVPSISSGVSGHRAAITTELSHIGPQLGSAHIEQYTHPGIGAMQAGATDPHSSGCYQ